MTNWKTAFAAQGAETLFSCLPLVVVLAVLSQAGHARLYWASPEWSFGASILFAQSIVRFVNGLIRAGGRTVGGPVAFTIAIVVVLGLVPSLTVLTMTLQTIESRQFVSPWLQSFQVLLFVLSIAAYLLLGTVSEVIVARASSVSQKSPATLQPERE
jgi:hypothetical protein